MTRPADRQIAEAIKRLASERGPEKTFCPSEAARRLRSDNWRELMDDVRRVAAALCDEGHLVATQRGTVVDPLTARGPIRLQQRVDRGEQ
ncbi:DUF3253 domain-containing protein [Stratiformator vulcanicus]|nr:DUF3253 domain-containing protein [Stratiformator vulcanicus]